MGHQESQDYLDQQNPWSVQTVSLAAGKGRYPLIVQFHALFHRTSSLCKQTILLYDTSIVLASNVINNSNILFVSMDNITSAVVLANARYIC
jgi:hypothetical protein